MGIMFKLGKGELFFASETGEVCKVGEVNELCVDNGMPVLEESIKKIRNCAEATVEIPAINIRSFHRRLFLKMIGIGNGTNNWLKMHNGIMDRRQQTLRALRLKRKGAIKIENYVRWS